MRSRAVNALIAIGLALLPIPALRLPDHLDRGYGDGLCGFLSGLLVLGGLAAAIGGLEPLAGEAGVEGLRSGDRMHAAPGEPFDGPGGDLGGVGQASLRRTFCPLRVRHERREPAVLNAGFRGE